MLQNGEQISEAFTKHEVSKDLDVPAPEQEITIEYGPAKVEHGNTLTPTQVRDKPSLFGFKTDAGAFYTVVMTDPDAPSRADPKFREWHHWLVVNVPGADVAQGDTMSEYIGSGPPNGTGLHRYVYLAYKQPAKICPEETKLTNRSGEGRANFRISKFAQKYNLGNPVAGNFFQAEWDDYVPKLYEQLSGK